MCVWYFSVRVYVYLFVYEDLCVYGNSACVCMCTYLFMRLYVCMVFQRVCVCVRICL